MNENMLKRLALKASKQIVAASNGYVEIKKQGQENVLKLYLPINLKEALDKIEKTEGYYTDLYDNAENALGTIKKVGRGVLALIDEIVAIIQWNQKTSKISYYAKYEDNLYVKNVRNGKTVYGAIKGIFDPEESSLKKYLEAKFTKI